jgi:amino acid transporter
MAVHNKKTNQMLKANGLGFLVMIIVLVAVPISYSRVELMYIADPTMWVIILIVVILLVIFWVVLRRYQKGPKAPQPLPE